MDFQGFQSSFPLLLVIFCSFFVLVLTWLSYRKYSSISKSWKWLLILLRTSALFIILILLLNPFFKREEDVSIKPKIAVLLDGSESTYIEKGEYSGESTYSTIIAELRNPTENIDVDFIKFGNESFPVNPDDFSADLGVTNIYEVLNNTSSSGQNYSAAILVTDGIITKGKDPSVLSSQSSFPVHTVALGDTSRIRDISLQSITTNSTGFTETKHPVSIDVSQFGYQYQRLNISIIENNSTIVSKEIEFNEKTEVLNTEFQIELNEPGLKQFEIVAQPLAGEWTEENNRSVFSVEVLESKKRILHLASQIHPDVKMIRSILSSDENVDLKTITKMGSSKSFKNYDTLPETIDLLIIHGSFTQQELNTIYPDNAEISVIKIDLPSSDNNNTYSLIERLSRTTNSIGLQIAQENSEHPVLELPEVDFSSFPPLFASINNDLYFPQTINLFESSFQNISTDSPLIAVVETGNIRKAHVATFGWYKMHLSTDNTEKEFVRRLFENLTDWTSSDPDNRLLKIQPQKNVFSAGETPLINASVINENGSVEPAANIEVSISGENYNTDFMMNNSGNGNYTLEIDNLPEGPYSFSATANKGSREIETRTGEFFVAESNLELSNTIRNNDLLRTIATNSGGIFMDFSDIDYFWNKPQINNGLTIRSEIRESYIFPVRYIYWFIGVIALLMTEWIIRKKFALP